MPAQLKPVLEQTFDLTDTDAMLGNDGDATTVTVAQATEAQHGKRLKLWEEFKRSFDNDGNVEITQRISPAEVRQTEVFLTLKSCNLGNENGEPLFRFPLKQKEFDFAWGCLPPSIAEEIHSKVMLVNPLWSGASGEE